MTITIKPAFIAFMGGLIGGAVIIVLLFSALSGSRRESNEEAATVEAPRPVEPLGNSESNDFVSDNEEARSPEAAVVVATLRSCQEIQASTYLDDGERAFYIANCLMSAVALPTIRPTASPTSVPNQRNLLPGTFEFIGAWPPQAMPIPYCVNTESIPFGAGNRPIIEGPRFVSLVQQAFATWEALPDSSVRLAYRGTCGNDPQVRDGVNVVGWGWLFSTAIGLAAPSSSHGAFIRGGSQIFEMDVVIDSRYAQSFDNPTLYVANELPHILLHETGHFLGLGHSSDPCSTMYPVGIKSGLCWIDIAALAQLYPLN